MDAVATRVMAGRSGPLPADWSWKRKTTLVVFALMMTYLHSLYILGFYVSELEYWWPFWTGMTVEQRLFSYALALFANFGLLVAPFLRAPSRQLRASLAVSFGCGALISIAWLLRDLWVMKFSPFWPLWALGFRELGALRLTMDFASRMVIRLIYAVAIYINLYLLMTIVRRDTSK
jgi:hypothetical protein